MPINISGTTLGQSTKDATALPSDVVNGKIFYGKNGRGIGSHECSVSLQPCTNIDAQVSNGKSVIKWKDPDDIVFNEVVISKWIGTKLVRKEGNYPSDITDGTLVIDSKIKNKYLNEAFIDTTVEKDKTYYYCLFPYTESVITKSDANRFYLKIYAIDPVLKNNSWEQVILAASNGTAQNLWKVGDEIDLVLSGTVNETITLQIWAFNRYDKFDKSGKASICFGCKNLMSAKRAYGADYTDAWQKSYLYVYLTTDVFNSIPAELKNYIVGVDLGNSLEDKIFVPEIEETSTTDILPIFSDNSSRIKKLDNGNGEAYRWWTRSTYHMYPPNGSKYQYYIDKNGTYSFTGVYQDYGICFCFNI